jgi:signal peptidase II
MVMEILIIIIGLILDRLTKLWAIKSLKGQNDFIIIKDFFDFSYVENRGAAFGIFQNKVIILTIITLIVICGMIFYLIKHRNDSMIFKISLALIIGGAVGNLIDRMYYKYVVDFIMFHYKDIYYFPNFNVADMMVVVGTALLALYIIRDVK